MDIEEKGESGKDKPQKKRAVNVGTTVGIFLGLIAGFIAVGTGVYISHDTEPLVALLPLGYICYQLPKLEVKYPQIPFQGGVLALLSLGIAACEFYLVQAGPLWTFAAIAWVIFMVLDL